MDGIGAGHMHGQPSLGPQILREHPDDVQMQPQPRRDLRDGLRLPAGRDDVVLLGSPVWMPLAWACVIVELGYPALRLYALLRRRLAGAAVIVSIVIGLLAGVTVGFYEYFAYRASWWKYERARVMIGDFCALYIPAGEVLMFLTVIPIAAHALSQPERRQSVVLESGALFAIAIALGYTVAYVVLEGL